MPPVECAICWEPVLPGHVCRCECGIPLDVHPPLAKPGTLRSWMAQRTDRSRPATDAAAVRAAIVAAFAEVGSYSRAAELLNARGVPTVRHRGRWFGATVRSALARQSTAPAV